MFADDTLIYASGESSKELEFKMNMALEMCVNELKMNAEKTKCMIVRGVRREQKDDIILKCSSRTLIERMQRMKYLDIIIDDTLGLGDHCDYMLEKMDKK